MKAPRHQGVTLVELPVVRKCKRKAFTLIELLVACQPKSRKAGRRPTRSFTLIELLVVIAIIAILASLLAPALKSARETAKGLQCLNNMKQVASALLQYAADYNDTFPPFWEHCSANYEWDSVGTGIINWQDYIGPKYLGEPKLGTGNYYTPDVIRRSPLHCPADQSVYSPVPRPVRSVAINGTMYPSVFGEILGDRAWPAPMGATMRRLAAIRSPAELVLVGDGSSGDHPPGGTTEWGGCSRYWDADIANSAPYYARHKGGMNFAFADGHAERKSWEWFVNSFSTGGGWYTSLTWDWLGQN